MHPVPLNFREFSSGGAKNLLAMPDFSFEFTLCSCSRPFFASLSSFAITPLFCHLLEHFRRFVPQHSPRFRHRTDQTLEYGTTAQRHIKAVIAHSGLDVPMTNFLLADIVANTVLAFGSTCNHTKNMLSHMECHRRIRTKNRQNPCSYRLLQTPFFFQSCQEDRTVEQCSLSRCFGISQS